MRKLLIILFLILNLKLSAQVAFVPLDTNFVTSEIVVPRSPLKYDILCIAQDCTAYDAITKKSAMIKDGLYGLAYMGLSNLNDSSGYLVISHEVNLADDAHHDGGAITQMKVERVDGKWTVLPQTVDNSTVHFRNINMSGVGGTVYGTSVKTAPWRKMLVGEGNKQTSNAMLNKKDNASAPGTGIRDTSDYTIPALNGVASGKTIKRFQNMNFVLEVDPVKAIVEKKHYAMGRFSHSGMFVKDRETVYMTCNTQPSVLLRYTSNAKNDMSAGELEAYKQGENGGFPEWISLDLPDINPDTSLQSFDSLLVIQEVALRKGATMFSNLAGLTYSSNTGKLYIAETGADHSSDNFTNPLKKFNGKLAHHLETRDKADGNDDNVVTDYYGRILEFNPVTDQMKVFLEGGPATSGEALTRGYHLSNPFSLDRTFYFRNGREFLVINENINGTDQGRNPSHVNSVQHKINETYWLDLSDEQPTVNDLSLFMIGPKGSVVKEGTFTKDGLTYFANVQFPDAANPYPYNKSMTIAVTGFDQYVTSLKDKPRFEQANSFSIWPNPASRILHFNKTVEYMIYDSNGMLIKTEKDAQVSDISNLQPGVYYVRTVDGEVTKLVVQ